MNAAEQQYNYKEFRRERLRDLRFAGGPRPGQWAPEIDLRTLDGGRFCLSEQRGVRPVLLEFGSFTCPMTLGSRPALRRLHARFAEQVAFVSVYVREAHPGELYPRHVSTPQKTSHACDWAREDEITWTVAIDGLDGATHRAFGALPNPVYLIDRSGRVAFRALWAGQERLLRRRISALLEREAAGETSVILGEQERALLPSLHGAAELERAVARGGFKAIENCRRELGGFVYGFERLLGKASPLLHPRRRSGRDRV